MSLIFEALKKLEREKQAPERGILVVGPSHWAGGPAGRARLSLAVLGALVLVGLGVVIGTFLRRPPQAAAPAAAPASPPPVTAPAMLDTGSAPAPRLLPPSPPVATPPHSSVAASATAPVAPATPRSEAPQPNGPTLTLQAITEQDGVPVALINDRLMRVGEAFEGVKVLGITAGEVEVQVEATGERRVLKF